MIHGKTKKKTTDILNDLIMNNYSQSYIAERNIVSKAYICLVKRRLSQLKYLPKIINNKIVCLNCNSDTNLLIHHDYISKQPIAIVCITCNHRIGNKTVFENEQLSGYFYSTEDATYQTHEDNVINIKLERDTAKKLNEVKPKLHMTRNNTYDEVINKLIEIFDNKSTVSWV